MKYITLLLLFFLFPYILSSNELQCNKYEYLSESNKCILYDYLVNNDYHQKYLLYSLTQSSNNYISSSQKPLIGPIVTKDDPNIYFISLLSSIEFSLSDYSYSIDQLSKKEGYVFSLIPDISNTTYNEKNNQTIINNIKKLRNIGSYLEEIKIIPKYKDLLLFNQPGVMIKYTKGDTCEENPSKNYETYIFIYCDTQNYVGSARLKSKKECAYIFEYTFRNACPLCIKSNSQVVSEGCIYGKKRVHYIEGENCIISNQGLETKDISANILKFNEDDIVYSYHKERFNSNENHSTIPPEIVENATNIYITDKIEEVQCDLYSESINKIKNNSLIAFIILIGVFSYILLAFCLIMLFMKYRKVNKEYSQLRQDNDMIDAVPSNLPTMIEIETIHNEN